MAVKANKLRLAAVEMGLAPGKKITISKREKEDFANGRMTMRQRKGCVLELYPHHFLCQVGNVRTCFRYGELLGEGRMVQL